MSAERYRAVREMIGKGIAFGLNMSDVFAWATADMEEVDEPHLLDEVCDAYLSGGWDAIVAWTKARRIALDRHYEEEGHMELCRKRRAERDGEDGT